jgi:hypothetical protein
MGLHAAQRAYVPESLRSCDGLDGPSSVAFGAGKGDGKNLFILNFSAFSAEPTPALLKAAVGDPGQQLP